MGQGVWEMWKGIWGVGRFMVGEGSVRFGGMG